MCFYQSLKVYDGVSWTTIGGGAAMVNLSPEAINIMKWAEKKMKEEQALKSLAEKNATISDLLKQRNDIDEKMSVVMTLIKPETQV